jgi:hypothetical protein
MIWMMKIDSCVQLQHETPSQSFYVEKKFLCFLDPKKISVFQRKEEKKKAVKTILVSFKKKKNLNY